MQPRPVEISRTTLDNSNETATDNTCNHGNLHSHLSPRDCSCGNLLPQQVPPAGRARNAGEQDPSFGDDATLQEQLGRLSLGIGTDRKDSSSDDSCEDTHALSSSTPERLDGISSYIVSQRRGDGKNDSGGSKLETFPNGNCCINICRAHY